MHLCQPESKHGKHKACHISQVVPGIGKQPQRIIIETDAELNEDKQNIQRNANYKRFIERRQFVDVLVMMFVRMCHARLRYLSILKQTNRQISSMKYHA